MKLSKRIAAAVLGLSLAFTAAAQAGGEGQGGRGGRGDQGRGHDARGHGRHYRPVRHHNSVRYYGPDRGRFYRGPYTTGPYRPGYCGGPGCRSCRAQLSSAYAARISARTARSVDDQEEVDDDDGDDVQPGGDQGDEAEGEEGPGASAGGGPASGPVPVMNGVRGRGEPGEGRQPRGQAGRPAGGLAKLSPEDRDLAEAQGYCAVENENRLGSMGTPIKLMVKGLPVFVCCQGCRKDALAEPDKTLAKAKQLRRKTAEERGK